MKYKGKDYIEILTEEEREAREAAMPANCSLRAGIDVGSTTVKLAVLDAQDQVVWSIYERHHSDVRATIG